MFLNPSTCICQINCTLTKKGIKSLQKEKSQPYKALYSDKEFFKILPKGSLGKLKAKCQKCILR